MVIGRSFGGSSPRRRKASELNQTRSHGTVTTTLGFQRNLVTVQTLLCLNCISPDCSFGMVFTQLITYTDPRQFNTGYDAQIPYLSRYRARGEAHYVKAAAFQSCWTSTTTESPEVWIEKLLEDEGMDFERNLSPPSLKPVAVCTRAVQVCTGAGDTTWTNGKRGRMVLWLGHRSRTWETWVQFPTLPQIFHGTLDK